MRSEQKDGFFSGRFECFPNTVGDGRCRPHRQSEIPGGVKQIGQPSRIMHARLYKGERGETMSRKDCEHLAVILGTHYSEHRVRPLRLAHRTPGLQHDTKSLGIVAYVNDEFR